MSVLTAQWRDFGRDLVQVLRWPSDLLWSGLAVGVALAAAAGLVLWLGEMPLFHSL